jgi:hypothetical protein
MNTRRFPPPWRVDKIPGGYVVRDANGQELPYTYSRENGCRSAAGEGADERRGAPHRRQHRAAARAARKGLSVWIEFPCPTSESVGTTAGGAAGFSFSPCVPRPRLPVPDNRPFPASMLGPRRAEDPQECKEPWVDLCPR